MLIGLNGFLGAGKDEVFKRIRDGVRPSDLQNLRCERIGFADKLKLSAAAALGVFDKDHNRNDWTDEEIIEWMNDVKENGTIEIGISGDEWDRISGREYLQWYGTEAHRDIFDTNFWVNQALPWDFHHSGKIVCVTDVRFPNEIQRIKNLGGMLWRVIGPDQSSANTHASEIPIADNVADVDIANNIRDDKFEYLDRQIIRAFELSTRKFSPEKVT